MILTRLMGGAGRLRVVAKSGFLRGLATIGNGRAAHRPPVESQHDDRHEPVADGARQQKT